MTGLLESVRANRERLEAIIGPKPPPDPDAVTRWVETIRAGEIFFYTTQRVRVGRRGIDWSGKHIHHQEWPAQLNRFLWTPYLAWAYRETHDESLATAAREIIEDWIDTHDYGAKKPIAPGDNTLSISIRLGRQCDFAGWWGPAPDFLGSIAWDEAFVAKMLASTRGQLDYLATHLAEGGNWRISHLDCLLYCGLLVPGLEEHIAFAVRHLNEAFHRQIHEDGSHMEHTPSYHKGMCWLFTRLWRLARGRPDIGLRINTVRVGRMWDYLVHSTVPDGGSAGIHDSSVWIPGPGRITALEERYAFLEAAGLDGRKEWDLDRKTCRHFTDAGQIFLRDSWSPNATFLAFDATRWGGGHCHLSRLAVSLYARGRMLLYDPGSFSYEMSDPFASYGKSTPAHNTINFNAMNQSEANPDLHFAHFLGEMAAVAVTYEGGYWPGRYEWGWPDGKGTGRFGRHMRLLLWLPGYGAVVADSIYSCDVAEQTWSAHWQLPAGHSTLDVGTGRAWSRSGSTNVLIQKIYATDDVALTIHEGERNPIRGWLPDSTFRGHGQYVPAPLVAFNGTTKGGQTVTLMTVLAPFQGERPPEIGIELLPTRHQVIGFRLKWPDGVEHVIALAPTLDRQTGDVGPLDSDGVAAVVARDARGVRWATVLEGMMLALDGRRIIDAPEAGAHITRT